MAADIPQGRLIERWFARGESVIADASFISAPQRAAATATALEARADLVQQLCTGSLELAARRMSARTRGLSDAGQAVAEEMRAIVEPWPDAMVIYTEGGGTAGLPGRMPGAGAGGDPSPRSRTCMAPHPAVHAPRMNRCFRNSVPRDAVV
jgi:hypothetical protein